jgi:hypothetical protein
MYGILFNVDRKKVKQRERNANDVSKLLSFLHCVKKITHSFSLTSNWTKKERFLSIFWSHASQQADYIDFGDAVTFDTTHKTNLYVSGTIIRGTLKTPKSQLVTPISTKLQRPDWCD